MGYTEGCSNFDKIEHNSCILKEELTKAIISASKQSILGCKEGDSGWCDYEGEQFAGPISKKNPSILVPVSIAVAGALARVSIKCLKNKKCRDKVLLPIYEKYPRKRKKIKKESKKQSRYTLKDFLNKRRIRVVKKGTSFIMYKYNPRIRKEFQIGFLDYQKEASGLYYISEIESNFRKGLKHLMSAYLNRFGSKSSYLIDEAKVNGKKVDSIYKKYGFKEPKNKRLIEFNIWRRNISEEKIIKKLGLGIVNQKWKIKK